MAPLDGMVEVVNPRVRQRPGLAHDDPYGEGWLCVVTPTNLKHDLENLLYGRAMLPGSKVRPISFWGCWNPRQVPPCPPGGRTIDDVFGHYPQLGWRRLVQEFLHTAKSRPDGGNCQGGASRSAGDSAAGNLQR